MKESLKYSFHLTHISVALLCSHSLYYCINKASLHYCCINTLWLKNCLTPVTTKKLYNKTNGTFNIQCYLCISLLGEKFKSYLIYHLKSPFSLLIFIFSHIPHFFINLLATSPQQRFPGADSRVEQWQLYSSWASFYHTRITDRMQCWSACSVTLFAQKSCHSSSKIKVMPKDS